jgi:hypothetical protein
MTSAHTNAHTNEKDNGRKKITLILLCLLAAIALVFGSLFAFFSDLVTGGTGITAGTLDLKVASDAVVITQNGTDIKTIGNQNGLVENFNPGDVVTVSVTVKNAGSKSAWLRGNLSVNFGDDLTAINNTFKVFEGTVAQADAASASGALSLTYAGDGLVTWTDSTPGVINGNNTASDYENESGLYAPSSDAPLFTGGTAENEATLTYTIYFLPTAGNAWQDQGIAFSYKVEALQYRNNASTTGWDTVAAIDLP